VVRVKTKRGKEKEINNNNKRFIYINDIVRWVKIIVKTERGLWSRLVNKINGL
jgi:hypothetical protein